MEAIRQLRWQLGRDAVCVHLTYVPYLKAADELKTKPTQHSVKELQGMGIQPDILVLRTERHLSDSIRLKVASFCNVDLECVVQSEDMPSIYEVPVSMQKQGLDAAIMRKIGIPVGETPAMKSWHDFIQKQKSASREVHIGLVGKYDLQDAYKSIRESLNLAGIYNDVKARIHFINSEQLTTENVATQLEGMAGIVVCPGFGNRGIEGKIIAAEYGRTNDIPTFGICLGMQMMVIEFARNVLGYKDAISAESLTPGPSPKGEGSDYHCVIDLMEEQKSITEKGGTMRLGAYECRLQPGSKVYAAYSQSEVSTPLSHREGLEESLLISERHRHRYEFNNAYKDEFESNGMKCVGINPASNLVEIVEIPEKKWYIGTQFHPEYSSTVLHPHPLFMSFIKACIMS
jgi:CTP synthase